MGPNALIRLRGGSYLVALQEAFAEGIRTGHQNMPEFRLEGDQIGDVIAYLKTLEK